jgi:predicted amino acid-binding ACT domain protein
MKRIISVLVLLLMVVFAIAQTPKINYQAVVRDSHNRLVVNTSIQVDVTINHSGGTYSENLSGTTNANGLLSLEIGGGNNFDAIDWSTATIQTTAHLPGNETLQDVVNVTAVPFALYANHAADVSINAPTVVAIYNDMQSLNNRIAADSANLVNFKNKVHGDSLALGALIDANADAINNLSTNVDNKTAALSNRIAADSTNLANFKNKVHGDSLALGALIDANAEAINNLSTNVDNKTAALSNRIAADSANLVNFKNKVHGDSLALGALIDANAEAINNLSTNVDNKTAALSSRIVADSTNLVNFKNKVHGDSLALGALIDANADAINNLSANVDNKTAALSSRIAADSTNLANFKNKVHGDSLALGALIDANADAINNLSTNVDNKTAALSNRIAADSTNLVNFKAKEKADSTTLGHRLDAIENAGYITKDVDYLTYYTTTTILENTYATKAEVTTNVDSVKGNLRNEIATKANTSYVIEQLALKANSADLKAVAITGSYDDLINKPTIPAQENADWNASSGAAQILNKPNLATVATSGSYNDLNNKPNFKDSVSKYLNFGCDSLDFCAFMGKVNTLVTSVSELTNALEDLTNTVAVLHGIVDSLGGVIDSLGGVIENLNGDIPPTPTPTTPEGVINGKFTINASGDQVYFSQGNLQYQASTGTWRFAEHQYDCILNAVGNTTAASNRATQADWIGLFGWGTGNNPTTASLDNGQYNTFHEWGDNAISNGGNAASSGWHTMTDAEWTYLFANNRWGFASISSTSTIYGIVLEPSTSSTINTNHSNPGDNSYASVEAFEMASAANGLVFLPVTGQRTCGDNPQVNYTYYGYYWTSTDHSSESYSGWLYMGGYVTFNPSSAPTTNYSYAHMGQAVRLVKDAN